MCPRMTLKNRVGGGIGVSCVVCDLGSLRTSVMSAIDVSKVGGEKNWKVHLRFELYNSCNMF